MKTEGLQKGLSVAIYARVSSTNQENEGTIETQISAVNEFIKDKGFLVVRRYLDNGWSGDIIIRPELDKLRVDAKKKIWDGVVVYDPDRLARRYSYQELIMDELREANKQVFFVTTPAPTNSIEKILYGVQGLFAEYERAKIAERFRLGKVRKANEGHVIASEAPYGYDFIKRSGTKGEEGFHEGYYRINEQEASVVKMIFTWVAEEGLSVRGIIKRLHEYGIAPRKSKRGVWSTSTVSTLLRNKTYIGEAHFGASVAIVPRNPIKKDVYRKYKKSSRKIKPESEWVKIPVPSILEVALFENARKRLTSNFETLDRNKKNQYLIAGKIWCTCGTRRHGEGPMHGKHLYYRCSSRVYSFPLKTTCEEKGLNARIVDACVWESLSNLMASPQKMQEQIDLWKAKKIQKKSTTNNKDYSREIKQLEEQQKRYTKAYSENVISLDELKEYTLPLKKKIDELKQQDELQKQKVESESSFVAPDYNQIETFAINAKSHLANLGFEEKRSIISSVIDKAVTSKGRVEIYGAIPVNYIENVLFKTVHRNGANTTQHFNDSNGIPFSFEINLN